MTITTQRDLIRQVAKRWRKTYEPFEKWPAQKRISRDTPDGGVEFVSKQQVADDLDALDPETATHEDVSGIIGNESWIRLTCDDCLSEVDATIQVGQEPDYENRTASLCLSCIRYAAAMMEKHLTTEKPNE